MKSLASSLEKYLGNERQRKPEELIQIRGDKKDMTKEITKDVTETSAHIAKYKPVCKGHMLCGRKG